MKVLLFLLLASTVFAWHPTIDGARVDLGYTATAPFWLGVSVPPGTGPINLRVYQRGPRGTGFGFKIEEFVGTDTQLQYVTIARPIRFTQSDRLVRGSIYVVPEPMTLALLAGGALLVRRRNARKV